MTPTPTLARASLRDINEAAFRSLVVHGASHGEAKSAANMVLQAELVGGGGLRTLLHDLDTAPWRRTSIEAVPPPGASAGERDQLVLRAPEGNRILRVAPLAVELVAGGDARAVAVSTGVSDPEPPDAAVLDAVTLELARVCGVGLAVVACPSSGSGPGASQARWARPDGSMGVGALDSLPSAWQGVLNEPGVLALRDVQPLRDIELTWISADDRARTRAAAGTAGLLVDAELWWSVHAVARRYLVPES